MRYTNAKWAVYERNMWAVYERKVGPQGLLQRRRAHPEPTYPQRHGVVSSTCTYVAEPRTRTHGAQYTPGRPNTLYPE